MAQSNFYEIYIEDEFGNGNYQIYYAKNEELIKKLVFKLYTDEKKNVIKDVKKIEKENLDNNLPLFNWNEEENSGYVTQDLGYVLKVSIGYNTLDLNSDKFKSKIYTIKDREHYMCTEQLGYFLTLKEGKEKLKLLSKEKSFKRNLAEEDEDGYKVKHGIIRKHIVENQKPFYSCNYFYWEKTSYEYEEYDFHSTGIILEEINIQKI